MSINHPVVGETTPPVFINFAPEGSPAEAAAVLLSYVLRVSISLPPKVFRLLGINAIFAPSTAQVTVLQFVSFIFQRFEDIKFFTKASTCSA